MLQIKNYLLEFYKCLYPKGYIIEISKKEIIEKELKITKEYLFCDSTNNSPDSVRLFIMQHTKQTELIYLLKNNTTILKFYDILI